MTTTFDSDLSALNIPKLLGQSLSIYVEYPLEFALIASVGIPAHLIVMASGPLAVVAQMASMVLIEVVFAALTCAAATAHSGARPNVFQSYGVAFAKLGQLLEFMVRYLGATILLTVTVIGIPLAVRTLIRWFFGPQEVLLGDMTAKDAISSSCQLVKGLWWQIASTIVLIILLFSTPSTAIHIAWWPYSTISIALDSLLSLAFAPIVAILWTLLFLELRARRRTLPAPHLA